MHGLASALRQRVLDRGAEIRYGARVVRVETSASGSGAVSGVLLENGEGLAADVVVAGVDRAVLARLVGENVPKSTYSPSVTTLCLAVEDPPEMPHETVLLAEHGPAIRIHVAAEQPTAWTVHAPGNHDAEAVLAAIAARGFDVHGAGRSTVRVLHTITAADREAATGVPGGAAYGPAANGLRSALLRSPVAQPTPGLFHVGASARPGSGLSFAALSGWQAAELVKARLKASGTARAGDADQN
jgi:phytoene dehydrogenase-like protein